MADDLDPIETTDPIDTNAPLDEPADVKLEGKPKSRPRSRPSLASAGGKSKFKCALFYKGNKRDGAFPEKIVEAASEADAREAYMKAMGIIRTEGEIRVRPV